MRANMGALAALAALAGLAHECEAQTWRTGGVVVNVVPSASGVAGQFDVTATAAQGRDSWLAVGFGPSLSSGSLMTKAQVVMGCVGCVQADPSGPGVLRYLYRGESSSSPLAVNDVSNAVFTKTATSLTLSFTASMLADISIATATRVIAATGAVNSYPLQHSGSARGFVQPIAVSSAPAPTTSAPTTPAPTAPTPAPAPTTAAPTPTTPTTRAPTTGAPTTGAPTTGAPTTATPTGVPTRAGEASAPVLQGLGTLTWETLSSARRRLSGNGVGVDVPPLVRITLVVQTTGWVGLSIGGAKMLGAHAVVGCGVAPGIARPVFTCVLDSYNSGCSASFNEVVNASFQVVNGRSVLEFVGTGIAGRPFSAAGDTVSVVYGSTPLYSAHDDEDTLSIVWSEANATQTRTSDPTAAYVAHGAMMAASFLFLYPGGAVASVLREHMEPGRWYHLHRYVQILTTIVTVAAFIVVFVLGTSATLASTHAKLGLAVFVATIIMPLLASSTKLRTNPKSRQLWRESHFVLGYFIFVAGLAACVLGLQQAKLYVKDDAALNGLTVFTYLGCGFLLACVMLVSFNRVNKWGVDEVRAARERIAATNQAKAQLEADKGPAQHGVSLRDDANDGGDEDDKRSDASSATGDDANDVPVAHHASSVTVM